jgi:CheY-like chemotaxis protein
MTTTQTAPRASTKEPSTKEASELSVLVVDDDPDIREIVADVLAIEGYSVATAANGVAALEILRTRRPRLILLDLTMPVMGGVEFRHVQMENLELAAIPTVVLTARSNPGNQVGKLSVRGCLAKPIRLDELLRIVAHYCS